jgi:hypothetical protein
VRFSDGEGRFLDEAPLAIPESGELIVNLPNVFVPVPGTTRIGVVGDRATMAPWWALYSYTVYTESSQWNFLLSPLIALLVGAIGTAIATVVF